MGSRQRQGLQRAAANRCSAWHRVLAVGWFFQRQDADAREEGSLCVKNVEGGRAFTTLGTWIVGSGTARCLVPCRRSCLLRGLDDPPSVAVFVAIVLRPVLWSAPLRCRTSLTGATREYYREAGTYPLTLLGRKETPAGNRKSDHSISFLDLPQLAVRRRERRRGSSVR